MNEELAAAGALDGRLEVVVGAGRPGVTNYVPFSPPGLLDEVIAKKRISDLG